MATNGAGWWAVGYWGAWWHTGYWAEQDFTPVVGPAPDVVAATFTITRQVVVTFER